MPEPDSRPTLAAPDEDPWLWLEEVEGARALEWVEARNAALLAALALALAPALAEARPGGGFSSGSRGSRSFNAPPATRTAPGGGTNTFDRSDMSRGGVNQATPDRPPSYTPAPAGSRFGGGFMGGMMGGLFGAGLLGMLLSRGSIVMALVFLVIGGVVGMPEVAVTTRLEAARAAVRSAESAPESSVPATSVPGIPRSARPRTTPPGCRPR